MNVLDHLAVIPGLATHPGPRKKILSRPEDGSVQLYYLRNRLTNSSLSISQKTFMLFLSGLKKENTIMLIIKYSKINQQKS